MEARILLAEDDTIARMLLADVLEGAGFYVTPAQDGETALKLLAHGTFDVVITDIRMRNVDGIHVLEAAKRCSVPPSVILLTGFGSLETAVAALRAGAQDYLLKPVAPDDLLNHVNRAVAHHQNEIRQSQAVRIIEQGLAQLQGHTPSKLLAQEPHPSKSDSTEPNQEKDQAKRYLHIGSLTIDTFRHTVSFQGVQLHLTPIEYALLQCLATSPGRVFSYREIVRCSHGHEVDEIEAQSLLKAHIRNMRRKIAPDYLVNVRGIGYMIVEPLKDLHENETDS
jgi:two-component system, OmpR family, response regulator